MSSDYEPTAADVKAVERHILGGRRQGRLESQRIKAIRREIAGRRALPKRERTNLERLYAELRS